MSNRGISLAASILKAGGVVAFPTETVFGIGALMAKPKAIQRIYKIKKRPKNKPLQVLVASLSQAKKLGKFGPQALFLAIKRWPGPLTLVVYKTKRVPKLITGGSDKVGLRIPKHRTIIELIRKCGPIAATSANMAGEKPSLTARAVRKKLKNLDYYLPGKVRTGKPSKVIDATDGLKFLRS
jgi:L-threonylcarbamoyladenylate synthase